VRVEWIGKLIQSQDDFGTFLLDMVPKWVYQMQSRLPYNSYLSFEDFVGIGFIGAMNVFRWTYPFTLTIEHFALLQKGCKQEIWNRIQDLLTLKRNINITVTFTDLVYNDNSEADTLEREESLAFREDPETLLLRKELETFVNKMLQEKRKESMKNKTIREAYEKDFMGQMSSREERTLKVKVVSVEKAKPHIVEPLDVEVDDCSVKGGKKSEIE